MLKAIHNFFIQRGFFKFAGILVASFSLTAISYAQEATVFQAAGPNPASIQSSVDQFRAALGGVDNKNNAPPADGSGRREINWDGGGSTATAPGPTPFDVFLNTRGNRSATPGTGFVQATPAGLATFFANPSYSTIFQPFSPSRLFSAVGSNITDTSFFIPGTNGQIAATTRGFGVVLADVDQPNGNRRGNRNGSTFVQYFGVDGRLIFSSSVPASPGDAGLSFIGIIFNDSRIARVRIIAGNAIPGANDVNGFSARGDDDRDSDGDDAGDVVMMDDFVYGEPQPIQ